MARLRSPALARFRTLAKPDNHPLIKQPPHYRCPRSWMLTRHISDLSIYNPDTTLDMDSIAHALYLHEAEVGGPTPPPAPAPLWLSQQARQ